MRRLLALLLLSFGLQNFVLAQTTPVACTGLCLQKVSCSSGGTTSISGTVFAPNGKDPLPNVTVYIPNAPVEAFSMGVSCPAVGTPPSGSPLAGTTTGYDGKFQIVDVPVGNNIPLVIVTGRWRRQITVNTTACVDTPQDVSFPRNKSEGDIPLIAVATGSVDSVECVLRKVGLDDSEFTSFGGGGRINLYEGDGRLSGRTGGAIVDSNTTTESTLMSNSPQLNQYDVLMLPCEGGDYTRSSDQLANLIAFTSAGGRVYSSHYAYSWMYQNGPFATVANWFGRTKGTENTDFATVDTSFSEGVTLSKWLQYVGATTTPGQMQISTIKHDFAGVNVPQSWLTLNTALDGDAKPVMQFVFDTPVGAKNQCGRVLFNEYHVETNTSANSFGKNFPGECPATAELTPQEKLLEFSLFELTSDGAAATLDPAKADFGSEPIGFTTASQKFTFTNNSTFVDNVNPPNISGDFLITGNTCGAVVSGASCVISVAFKPTALGARTGILTVSAGAQTLVSSLTGTGVADITVSTSSIAFGSLDVGASRSSTLTIQSVSPAAIPFPGVTATGDFTATTTCGASLAANSSCTVTVTFKPSTTGPRTGTLTANSADAAYSTLNDALTGNGVDFTVALSPTSGNTIAGYAVTSTLTMTPLAGFAAPVTVTCTTNAVASPCSVANATAVLSAAGTHVVTIDTTPKYTVVGYGGMGSSRWLAVVAMLSASLLWVTRRKASAVVRASLLILVLAASSLLTTGCTGKLPAVNPAYTAPGSYTYTMTATDGFLVHSVTYSLTVTAK